MKICEGPSSIFKFIIMKQGPTKVYEILWYTILKI